MKLKKEKEKAQVLMIQLFHPFLAVMRLLSSFLIPSRPCMDLEGGHLVKVKFTSTTWDKKLGCWAVGLMTGTPLKGGMPTTGRKVSVPVCLGLVTAAPHSPHGHSVVLFGLVVFVFFWGNFTCAEGALKFMQVRAWRGDERGREIKLFSSSESKRMHKFCQVSKNKNPNSWILPWHLLHI